MATTPNERELDLHWSVWRQDDSGNRFEMGRYETREAADAVVAEFEARGHKQMYWVQYRGRAV